MRALGKLRGNLNECLFRVTGTRAPGHCHGARPSDSRSGSVPVPCRSASGNAPGRLARERPCRLSDTLDRLCKLDMAQHCKRGLGGKGRRRMRPKLRLSVFGHAFRVNGVMAWFRVIWVAVLCHIDLFESS